MIINYVELLSDDGFWRLVPEPVTGETVTDNIQNMRLIQHHTYGAIKSRFSQEKGVKLLSVNNKINYTSLKYTGDIYNENNNNIRAVS